MTPRQKDMLDAIRDLTVDGVSPTYEQLRVHLGIASKSGVNRMIVGLEAQGYLRRLKGCRRTVQIVHPATPSKTKVQIADEVCQRLYERRQAGQVTTREVVHAVVMEALR